MSNALDAFRAQRDAVEQVHARLKEVTELVHALRAQIEALGQDQAFREVLRNEATWLDRAERTIAEVRRLREQELSRFWPGVWRRWMAAVALSLATLASFGAGHALASRPQDAELARLRQRVELLDFVAERVLTMTPAERRQFDALMKGRAQR
jgi:hypothetical protein